HPVSGCERFGELLQLGRVGRGTIVAGNGLARGRPGWCIDYDSDDLDPLGIHRLHDGVVNRPILRALFGFNLGPRKFLADIAKPGVSERGGNLPDVFWRKNPEIDIGRELPTRGLDNIGLLGPGLHAAVQVLVREGSGRQDTQSGKEKKQPTEQLGQVWPAIPKVEKCQYAVAHSARQTRWHALPPDTSP